MRPARPAGSRPTWSPSVSRRSSPPAGLAAAPIFPIGLDWLAAAFPRDGPATSWALIGSFAGGIAGPAAVAGVVWLIGVPAVPAVLSSLAAATTLAFVGLRSKVVRLEAQTVP